MSARILRLLAVAGTLLPAVLHAETTPAGLRRIGSACQAETARLCPAQESSVRSPREQLICLRPYKTSLSLSCRAAVNAMSTR